MKHDPVSPSAPPEPMMPVTKLNEPHATFIDPRSLQNFQAAHWPLCNGRTDVPIGSADSHIRRCVEFLAAYYEVNCRQAQCQAARESGENDGVISGHLEAVADALVAVDALEDRYLSIGFFGEPVMDGIYYRDVHFVRPGLGGLVAEIISFSSHFAIPGLEEIPASELEGTPRVFRFEHAKVDL